MRRCELEDRLAAARSLVELGFRLGIGTIVGLPGQTPASLADDILLAGRLGASMTSASPFVPAPDTPLAPAPHGDLDLTLNVLAVMRLAHPAALIPTVSALEALAPGAQSRGLMAGANVITVNFSPAADQARYPIYGRNRFVVRRDHAFRTLEQAGLEPRLGRAAFDFDNQRQAGNDATSAAVMVIAVAALAGCAANVQRGSVSEAPIQIAAAASKNVVLNMTGSSVATGSEDWEPFKGEWRSAMAAAAASRGATFAAQEGAPRAAGEPGTLVVVDVNDYRYLSPGARSASA